MKKIRKNTKTGISFSKKRAKGCCIQILLNTYKHERSNFFSQTKELFKMERYLNLNNFGNRNTITKISLSPHNLAINNTKSYNLQEDTKICQNCEKER